MDIRFDVKTIIVTGAGSGIGAATAEELATSGATVIVEEPDELVQDATTYKFVGNAIYSGGVLMTLRNPDQVEQAMRVITQARTLISGD